MRFNVGRQVFDTTTTTLANAGRDSMLGALLDSSWNVSRSSGGGGVVEYFIDRNPACFAVLLDLLHTGSLHVPPHLPEKLPYREALYYGLLDHVRIARWARSTGTASTSRPPWGRHGHPRRARRRVLRRAQRCGARAPPDLARPLAGQRCRHTPDRGVRAAGQVRWRHGRVLPCLRRAPPPLPRRARPAGQVLHRRCASVRPGLEHLH
jgi:hypothetical protein